MLQIITDSTADLSPDVAAAAGIWVVPLTVRFGQESYQDGVDLSKDEFYAKLRVSPKLPATAAPPPGVFAARYAAALAAGKQVLAIHLSRELSSTYSAALLAAAEFGDDVAVADSRSTSMGLGMLALRAAEAARAGASLAEARRLVQELAPCLRIFLALGTLENLHKGGRIGRASVLLGALLSVKPIISVVDGYIEPVERVRTFSRALRRLVELTREHEPSGHVAVGYTDVPEVAQQLRAMLLQEMPGLDVSIYQGGSTIGTYVGHGAVATLFLAAGPSLTSDPVP